MTVVAIVTDLMDRSKISGAIEGVQIARPDDDALADARLTETDTVIVDLAVAGGLDAAVASGARVLAYGRHTSTELLAEAEAAGAETMPRSTFFHRLGEGTLL